MDRKDTVRGSIDDLIASDWVGQDRIDDLKNLKEKIERFDDQQWWEELGYYTPYQFPPNDRQNLNKILKRLKNAKKQGKEGDASRKNGSFFEYNIHLEGVFIEFPEPSDRSIPRYEIKGKWSSYVYQEINFLGFRVDQPWGTKKRPNGSFTIEVELNNGTVSQIVSQIKIKVDRYDDSANNYAANKVKELIESKMQDLGSLD
ncbi:MAG: hypothetical protein F6K18_12520 [Okeania sp. SIO2C2]|uniref:hypothetical protein n=1 Tax=Okeania sp. SIO2C2 TaxID=2607787 RepID=UPI0013B96015|nr:hypothetical protein [Okeania sp. SIO2C2]NEP87573.1 hypothetical protein [Okeania sp. SIO2C2]